MYIRDGVIFDINVSQVVGDNQYPAGWFLDAEARAAADIEPLRSEPPVAPDGKRAVHLGFERDGQGWFETFELVDLTAPEIAAATVALAARASAGIAKCYSDVDAVYAAAVGQRGPEYLDAEADARAWKAANYAGDPTANVSSYAAYNPTGVTQTNRWAADAIITRADAFGAAKLAMRERRFQAQAAMRAATTQAGLDAAIAVWGGFIAALRAQLGL